MSNALLKSHDMLLDKHQRTKNELYKMIKLNSQMQREINLLRTQLRRVRSAALGDL